MNIPDAALGAIAASIIGAIMVLISTILSKEQKTSEFRQAWVDALRNDLAEYIGGVSELAAYATDTAQQMDANRMDFLEKNFDAIEKNKSLGLKILLRLNPDEHKKLSNSIATFLEDTIKEIHSKDSENETHFSEIESAIVAESQRILKEEWKRVKKGEPAFRIVKYGSLFFAAIGLCFLVLHFYGKYADNMQPTAPVSITPKQSHR
jgi:hypothetical protein